jgi:hypothetical protein
MMLRVPLAPAGVAPIVRRACLLVLAFLFVTVFAGPAQAAEPPASTVDDLAQEVIPAPRAERPLEMVAPLPALANLALDTGQGESEAPKKKMFWDEQLSFERLPDSLLWQVPWANQREPRMYATFNDALRHSTIDTAIGAEWGLFRLAPEKPFEGLQFDMLAAVFTRFDNGALMAADYRAGAPFTYAKDNWQAKVGYEHTSGHFGDKFIDHNPDFPRRSYTRDEIVCGLAYRFWDQFRAYGQVGFAFGKRRPPGGTERYDAGLEWSRPLFAKFPLQPFAAVDLDFRPEQNYIINRTVQVGWMWQNPDTRRAVRLAVEYYAGRDPFGAFVRNTENWVGFSLLFDW